LLVAYNCKLSFYQNKHLSISNKLLCIYIQLKALTDPTILNADKPLIDVLDQDDQGGDNGGCGGGCSGRGRSVI
jgi:hypothetical protein